MSNQSVGLTPPILEALRLQRRFLTALDSLSRWLGRNNNHWKVQLYLIIQGVIDKKREELDSDHDEDIDGTIDGTVDGTGVDASDSIFPSFREINNSLNRDKINRFRVGSWDFDPESLTYEHLSNLGAYKYALLYIELTATELTTYISTEEFLEAFNQLPIEEKVFYQNQLLDRLNEAQNGQRFILNCINTALRNDPSGGISTETGNSVPIFHFHRIEEASDYLALQEKTNTSIKLAVDLLDYNIKCSAYIFARIIDAANILNARFSIHHSIQQVLTFFDEDVLDGFSDFIEAETGWDPDLDDHLEELFNNSNLKRYIRNANIFLNRHRARFSAIRNPDSLLSRDTRPVFKSIKGLLGIWQIGLAGVKFSEDSTLRNYIELNAAIVGAADDINNIPRFTFAEEGTTIARGLSRAAFVANVVGIILSVYDADSAFAQEDYSVGVGHTLSAAGASASLVGGLVTAGVISGVGAALWWTGIGLALAIAGFIFVAFTRDPLTEEWFKKNFFGIHWLDIDGERIAYETLNPTYVHFKFFNNGLERQIIKFYSIIHSFNIRTADLVDISLDTALYIGQNRGRGRLIESLESVYRDLGTAVPDHYTELVVEYELPRIVAQEIKTTFYFWDNENHEFFWNSESMPLIARPLTSEIIRMPTNWTDSNVIFVKQNLTLNEDNGDIMGIENYSFIFLVLRAFIENSEGDTKLSHMEIRLNLIKYPNVPRETGIKLIAGKDV